MSLLLPLTVALAALVPQQLGGPVHKPFAKRPGGLTFIEHALGFNGTLRSVAVARLDADLLPDLAVMTWEFDGPFAVETRLSVLKGLGGGGFALAWDKVLDPQDDVHAPRAVDANADGWMDLSCPGFAKEGALRFGDGSLGFDTTTWVANFGGSVLDIAYADFTGDGLLDSMTLIHDFGSFYVDTATNEGGGVFLGLDFVFMPFVNNQHAHLMTADLDGNGVASDGVVTSDAGLVIFGYPPTPSFPQQEIPGDFGEAVTVDLENDGDRDLLVVRPGDRAVQLLHNQGAGVFAPGATIDVGQRPSHIARADFDQDGDPDFAVTTLDGVRLLLNDGTGALEVQDPISVGTSPQDIEARDIDLDGDIDLVVVNEGDGTVSILLSQLAQ